MVPTRPTSGPDRDGVRPSAGQRRSRPVRRVARSATVVAAAFVMLVAGPASAASPAPSAGPSSDPDQAGGLGNLEVWLDQPLASRARAGSTIPVGMMIWDASLGQLSDVGGVYLHLHPASGRAKPTSAETRSDFPGHVSANVIVPRGGAGDLEVGVSARECRSDGTCRTVNIPFRVAGVGPPPGAPRSRLVSAIAHAPTGQVPIDQSMDVVLDIRPRAAWDAAALDLPDRVILVAFLRDQLTSRRPSSTRIRARRGRITGRSRSSPPAMLPSCLPSRSAAMPTTCSGRRRRGSASWARRSPARRRRRPVPPQRRCRGTSRRGCSSAAGWHWP